MPVTTSRSHRLAAALLAALLASAAHAQLKAPKDASSQAGTGLRSAPTQPAPRAAAPATTAAPAASVAPASSASSASSVAPASSAVSASSVAPAAPDANADDTAIDEKQRAGSAVAAGWLTLLDRKDWGTAWETTAGMFRSTVPLDKWMDGVPKVRNDLGAFVERAPATVSYKTELVGRPKGDYVTVLFASRFEKRAVDELVTTVREPDGRWRVTGYSTR